MNMLSKKLALQIEKKKQFFSDLFTGPFPGHGVRVDIRPEEVGRRRRNNILSKGDVETRGQLGAELFRNDCRMLELVDDDRVPWLHVWSGTAVFAEAFGCPVFKKDGFAPSALPCISSSEEAEKLEAPDILSGPIRKLFDIADRMIELCGEDHPVRICDMQSPFDIAAQIWDRKSFFLALIDHPQAVHRLLRLTTDTLTHFVKELTLRYKNVCLVHYPELWMPPDLGVTVSEDEAGAISPAAFEEFCLPYLEELSTTFGGISLHCCAAAEHQWDNFLKLPKLRYMNLWHPPASVPSEIERFSGKVVLAPGGSGQHSEYKDFVSECMELAKPDTRFFFFTSVDDIEKAPKLCKEIRKILKAEFCPLARIIPRDGE